MINKRLAIVIPVFNNWNYTNKTLKSLSLLGEDHKIIVVDNGSSDETKNLKSSDKIETVRNTDNQGFAKACNQGFEFAERLGYENVMFLNNDIKIIEDQNNWTKDIIKKCYSGKIIGPTVGCLDDNFNFVCEAKKFPTRGFSYMSGWCLSAATSTWKRLIGEDEIGPFSTLFFAYFEDTDLSFRAKALGIEFIVEDIPVKHIGRVTGKKVGLSSMYSASRNIFMNIWNDKKEMVK